MKLTSLLSIVSVASAANVQVFSERKCKPNTILTDGADEKDNSYQVSRDTCFPSHEHAKGPPRFRSFKAIYPADYSKKDHQQWLAAIQDDWNIDCKTFGSNYNVKFNLSELIGVSSATTGATNNGWDGTEDLFYDPFFSRSELMGMDWGPVTNHSCVTVSGSGASRLMEVNLVVDTDYLRHHRLGQHTIIYNTGNEIREQEDTGSQEGYAYTPGYW